MIIIFFIGVTFPNVIASQGLWSSAEELAEKPMSGSAWDRVKAEADLVNPNQATVSDQDNNNNVGILAAGIVYARTKNQIYKDKVIAAVEKLVSEGKPAGKAFVWGRETGAYVLAADLVDYRTPEFETWIRNMAEVWLAEDQRTQLNEFKIRPNNHGTMAFGSIVTIYAFLQDSVRLQEIRDHWIKGVVGQNPEYVYGGPPDDFTWHADPNEYREINPKGAVKDGLDIDGILPDDMRRNGSFQNPPPLPTTSYHWEVLQGILVAARIFDRVGMPIWTVADSAIYRAFHVLEVRWEKEYGGWAAAGDDEWMLPFIDEVYGSSFSKDQQRLWDHGKNAGWGYVVWKSETGIKTGGTTEKRVPMSCFLHQNYPNPFNSTTNIGYDLAENEQIKMYIFDILGRTVSTLIDGHRDSGNYSVEWDALDSNGHELPTGIYMCRLQGDYYERTIKLALMR